ncbi:hypothetical protein DLM45_00855 [Hyphomicrobium methylovorum]|uniref:hypothetical protein n=1 Tax=Hyphomicrobium methylovorum TaxID=84 RepID=UPI0015E693BB|nr:hypothetical protein [Hyphomicrobium methylovorum]MBA2124773.1 hypothetical protein [Hyphomicrobium methylovorum]
MAYNTNGKAPRRAMLASAMCVAAALHGLIHGTPDLSDSIRALVLLTLAVGIWSFRESARPLGMSWREFVTKTRQS